MTATQAEEQKQAPHHLLRLRKSWGKGSCAELGTYLVWAEHVVQIGIFGEFVRVAEQLGLAEPLHLLARRPGSGGDQLWVAH